MGLDLHYQLVDAMFGKTMSSRAHEHIFAHLMTPGAQLSGRMMIAADRSWSSFYRMGEEGGILTLTAHGGDPAGPAGASPGVGMEGLKVRLDDLADVVDQMREQFGPFNQLRLMCCYAGDGGKSSLAAQLSSRFPDSEVIAFKGPVPSPTMRIIAKYDGGGAPYEGSELTALRMEGRIRKSRGAESYGVVKDELRFRNGRMNVASEPSAALSGQSGRIRRAGEELSGLF